MVRDDRPFRRVSQRPDIVVCTIRQGVSAFSGLLSPRVSKRQQTYCYLFNGAPKLQHPAEGCVSPWICHGADMGLKVTLVASDSVTGSPAL